MSAGRVLIAVTHLLGSGHLVRAAHLARALAGAGFDVTLASGGMPLRDMTAEPFAFAQLPPVKVLGVDFRNLLDADGIPINEGRRAQRREMLAALAARLKPDIVVTEHFPFGRRQLAEEFLGLIAAAKTENSQALILSSIRDVLVAPRADRVLEAERRIAALFDAVLVHGDAAFLPLEASWPVSPALAKTLHYTGYLTDTKADIAPIPSAAILISGGGSGAALPLFELALAAARLSEPALAWRILVGNGVAEADFARLQASASKNLVVERARADFPALLAGCALSVSQAGYNTVLDLVQAGCPAIVVPFDAGNETEQAIRAAAMARAGLAQVLPLSGLTPAGLTEAVAHGLQAQKGAMRTINREGGAGSVAVVSALLAARRQAER